MKKYFWTRPICPTLFVSSINQICLQTKDHSVLALKIVRPNTSCMTQKYPNERDIYWMFEKGPVMYEAL